MCSNDSVTRKDINNYETCGSYQRAAVTSILVSCGIGKETKASQFHLIKIRVVKFSNHKRTDLSHL